MPKGVKGSGPVNEDKPVKTSFNILPTKTKALKMIAVQNDTTMQSLIDEGIDYIIKKYNK